MFHFLRLQIKFNLIQILIQMRHSSELYSNQEEFVTSIRNNYRNDWNGIKLYFLTVFLALRMDSSYFQSANKIQDNYNLWRKQ